MTQPKLKFFFTLFATSTLGLLFAQKSGTYSLNFNPKKYEIQTLSLDGKTFTVRAYENIVYVKNPVDTAYQKLNIYIPMAYFEGKSINGYNASTAPIFFPNKIGGYSPATPATALPAKGGDFPGGMPPAPNGGNRPDGMGSAKPSALLMALSKGYIVASSGARGRTTKAKNGTYTGKAPAGIVDLKAAIRYLKFNDKKMPGDANKIISNGTSAGGAMSTLVGATGNNKDYEPYLKALGAAAAKDDVFAVSAYCPITNLDHADMAYEWQFNGINSYKKRGFPPGAGGGEEVSLTEEQIRISNQLKTLFPAYLNSLNLKDKNGELLLLDANGNGNFKELVKSYLIAAAQKALHAGKNLSALSWIKIANGNVNDLDFDAYLRYLERMKTPPAFDALDLSSPENQLFGNEKIDKLHFTNFSAEHSTDKVLIANEINIRMMNPMYYIGQVGTKTAKHWRIRHGSKDKDTSLAISILLGTYLQNKGYNVSLELPWDVPHSGDYDLEELFQWMDGICK